MWQCACPWIGVIAVVGGCTSTHEAENVAFQMSPTDAVVLDAGSQPASPPEFRYLMELLSTASTAVVVIWGEQHSYAVDSDIELNTDVQLTVVTPMLGTPPDTISMFGGVLGDSYVAVSEQVIILPDTRVFVLLRDDPELRYPHPIYERLVTNDAINLDGIEIPLSELQLMIGGGL